MKVLKLVSLVMGASLAVGCAAIEAALAPRAEAAGTVQRFARFVPGSAKTVDHAAFDRFLAKYAARGDDGIVRVAYGRVSPADRAALGAYVGSLEATPVSLLDRPEQLAYWIDLYDAVTLRVVLEHYPVKSIRDIRLSWNPVAGPWDAEIVHVEGQALSLNDVEHRIVRAIWRDPRIHYALNCAALGCPNLATTAWRAADLEARLDAAARDYVNHPRGVRFDGDRLVVSKIYRWYREDFGGDDAGVIAHLARYAAPPLAARLAGATTIADAEYDWRLNDASVR